jgi:hypothetical protein
MGVVTMRVALADPPGPAGAPAPAASPSVPASPAAAAPGTAPAPATQASTPAPATAAAPATTTNSVDEKNLRSAGYKPEMRNGVSIWCRKEPMLGSRLAEQKNCGTAEQLRQSVQEIQNRIQDIQHKQINPTRR